MFRDVSVARSRTPFSSLETTTCVSTVGGIGDISRVGSFLHGDHVLPLSRGGGNSWENVVASCSPCNNRKGDRLPREAGMKLLAQPKEPNYVRLVWTVRRVTPTQAKYIRMFYGVKVLATLRAGSVGADF